MQRRIHISWHIAWAAGGVLVGAATASAVTPSIFASAAWPLIAAGIFFLVIRKQIGAFVIVAMVAGGLVGLWRGACVRQALQAYRSYYGQQVELSGTMAEDVSFGLGGDQRLSLRSVRIAGRALPGNAWVSSTSRGEIKRGDIVFVRGKLNKGFGTMPASMFRAEIVGIVQPRPGDIARQIRDRFAASVRRALPEPEASLGVGYLVGQRSALPETLEQQLRIVGLTHVVVASGYNLTILVSLARRLLARWSKYLATLAGALLTASFMLITGFSPSMSRAGLVAGLSLAAWYYGRSLHPLVLLPFAAACTVLIRPAYIWGDIGWYLSFTAFAGVIVLSPLLQRYFWGESRPGVVRQVVVDTLAAQLATAPIIMAVFGQYSLYALPANVLVLPLVPLAMLGTCIAGLAGFMSPTLAEIAGWPPTLLLRFSINVVERFAQLPDAQGEVTLHAPALVASYVGLLLVMLWIHRATGLRLKNQ